MTKKYQTPKFDGSNYKRWKLLVNLWEKVTEVEEDKRGAALVLNMSGSALDIALAIDPDKVKVKDVIEIMDKVYVDENDLSIKCDEFDRLLRKREQSMKEFIHVYEQKVNELKTGKVEIPDIVLATKILRAANLVANHYLIARSSCTTMTFENAKNALLRISEKCPDSKNVANSSDMVQVKQEMVEFDQTLYNETEFKAHNIGYGNDGSDRNEVYYQNHGNRGRPTYQNQNRGYQGRQCYVCGDTGHGFKECPNSQQRNKNVNWTCYGCGDSNHLIKDCQHLKDLHVLVRNLSHQSSKNPNRPQGRNQPPHKTYNVTDEHVGQYQADQNVHYSEDEVNFEKPVLFFQSDVGNEFEDIFLVGETVNKAVLDSGASKTVCGLEWYKCYIDSLDEQKRREVVEYPSETIFRFGVGKLKAIKMVYLPVVLCDKNIKFEVHVVNTDIPLLLSLKTMKEMGLLINFETDKVVIDGKQFDLATTTTGHYTLSLEKNSEKNPDAFVNIIQECIKTPNMETKKKAVKLHKRFAHADYKRIMDLVRKAGSSDPVLEKELEKLQNSCEFCLKHQRASPRPKVCLPLAGEFNELVSMDLKKINGEWILHCIDYLTRFSAAHTVKNHDPDEIIEKFFTIWISLFGPPQKILSDNGGEFRGSKWEPVCEAFNINQKSTAAEAPFSNGICERHNLLIGEMTQKIIEDVGCSLQTALMWAVHAKNSLINIHGFSPYQLVFGKNPNMPGNSNNKLPALSSETSSEIIATHLNGLRAARHAYIKAESSDRIARALRGRVFEGTYKKFSVGDTVYYKRLNKNIWQGPGKVIAQIGTQVLVQTNAGLLVKVHPCKIVLKHEAEEKIGYEQTAGIGRQIENRQVSDNESSSDSESDSESNDTQETCPQRIDDHSDNVHSPEAMENSTGTDGSHQNDSQVDNSKSVKTPSLLKQGEKIIYKPNEQDDEWVVAEIVSRGGKKGGKWQNFWNIKKLRSGITIGVNLDEVDWIKEDENAQDIRYLAHQIDWETYILNYDSSKSSNLIEAKEKEIEKWRHFDVFEEVKKSDFPNQELLSCRWVDESKQVRNEIEHKCRLVARGFQESEPPASDSPTAQKSITRMCLILCNLNGWKVEALDIRAAFLQSNNIERMILMVPPKEFRKDKDIVWRIKKPIYGLNDGARKWFITMRKKLVEYGCTPLSLDPSVYVYKSEGYLSGFCSLHVDDFLIGGDPSFQEHVVQRLISEFVISTQKIGKFTYVGWDINQTKNYIEIDQIAYQEGIKLIELSPARSKQVDHEGNDDEKKSYQQLLGKLQWISCQSRPDIRYLVLECSLVATKPKIKDILNINKVVKKMNKNAYKIRFGLPQHTNVKDLSLLAFSDASLSNLPDKISSTRSFIIFVSGNGKIAPLSWCSKKLERVAKTIIYAEGIALGRCLDEAVNLRQALLQAIGLEGNEYSDILPVVGVTDSKSLWDNIYSSSQADDLKLRREVASIREQIELKEVSAIKWVPTHIQLADCLTKSKAPSDTLIKVLTSGDFEL